MTLLEGKWAVSLKSCENCPYFKNGLWLALKLTSFNFKQRASSGWGFPATNVLHLLSENGASEDGVVPAARPEVDLDRKLVLGAPDAGNLPLMHHLLKKIIQSTQRCLESFFLQRFFSNLAACLHLFPCFTPQMALLGFFFQPPFAATGIGTHISSVVSSLRNLNSGCFTYWATKATRTVSKFEKFQYLWCGF